MKNASALLLATAVATASACNNRQLAVNEPVPFDQVKIHDSFWQPRIQALSTTTVPFCMDQCCTQTNRVNNFAIAAGKSDGQWKGIFYDDSDLYKTIEGAAYTLVNNPNPQLEAQLDSIIALIAAAQNPDGYISTYFTVVEPDQKWTDMDKHEMYCGGHLIEAAIAYYKATGKSELLDVATKFADYLVDNFGPGKKDWVPGHPEIELALVRLYRLTGDRRYLDESHFLIDERGHGKGYWKKFNTRYYLDEVPATELEKICGHAVRAMYLFTGMADWSAQSGSEEYIPALDRLWDNTVGANMYITGGIGSSAHNEGFTTDYDLPNMEAYCETCASVGMVLWNQRMNMLKGDGKYIDVLERALYNGALAGISLSADRFFYVNPLASSGNHHRQPWYGTACCPSQISRFMPSVGGYVYATSDDALWVNLYIGSSTTARINGNYVSISQETEYPWNGDIEISIDQKKSTRFSLKLRIPGWCDSWSVAVNGKQADTEAHDGYVSIDRKWSAGDKVTFSLDMPVKAVAADSRVTADEGRRAVQRGPVVYCLEETDNKSFEEDCAMLSPTAEFTTVFEPELLGGVVTVTAQQEDSSLKFIPYYAWNNRTAGWMEVWVKYQ